MGRHEWARTGFPRASFVADAHEMRLRHVPGDSFRKVFASFCLKIKRKENRYEIVVWLRFTLVVSLKSFSATEKNRCRDVFLCNHFFLRAIPNADFKFLNSDH